MTVAPTRSWALERNDRRVDFLTDPTATMFAESGPFQVTRHRHPAWKVVLSLAGPIEVRHADGVMASTGMIVPPQLVHTCATSSAYVALFLDPWKLRSASGPCRLDVAETQRVLDALGPTSEASAHADLAAACAELTRLHGEAASLDPRLAHAVGEYTRPDHDAGIEAVAAGVGISPSRLRALARDAVGIPLTRLRQWARLRVAVADLPRETVAAAAASAGFADQAHLTRTARRLTGRTPSSVFPR
ncbi:helix-turn-helix domain-containing protein [Kitasatospora aureofaciens]|uniref:HTH araC/xylS-type domain-containing protein n=1 Tax=Kitasatospora aureofaciens TaxID=1894 RepID=A0A8H9HWT4_KITAU|nr:helix-turn-helix domain-containing protein [Kitasatospora aureofaciens]GGU95286.1 hypothetical protein GCM10010502_56360 [Kitasatospora aureofaciens]